MTIPDLSTLHRTNINEKSISINYPKFHKYIIERYNINIRWLEKLYLYYNDIEEPPRCPICGNYCLFISFFKGYRKYCSQKCTYNPDRTKKICDTIEKRYGVKHALQSDVCRKKYQDTSIERYGVKNISMTEQYKTKFRKTMYEMYGGIGSSSDIIKERVVKTRRKNRLNNEVIKNQIGYNDNGEWIMKCPYNNPVNDICIGCDKTYSIPSGNYFDRIRMCTEPCTKLLPIGHSNQGTTLELFVRELLDKYNIEYQTNIRNILNPKELDIYIPSKKLAIECNGVYWHSFKEPSYHINKFLQCEKQGIRLLSLWEDWIRNKPKIIESILKSKLGIIEDKIYARNCIIKEVPSKECSNFLNNNHIQGHSSSSIKLGLYYNDELVSVMTFSKSRVGIGKNEDGWELVRFCNKMNNNVIGGASKLLKYFILHYNPNQIISYSCNDISSGNLYKVLGFERGNSSSSYWYIDQNTFQRLHRFNFRKVKLKELGYDTNNLTESQIMSELPYWRIYDAGTTRWVMKLK